MCQLCGCSQYLEQGKETVLRRAVEIVEELELTAQNADDYEATEVISNLIAPFGSKEDDAYQTAAWISNLQLYRAQRLQESNRILKISLYA